ILSNLDISGTFTKLIEYSIDYTYVGLHNYQVHTIVFNLPSSLFTAPCSLINALNKGEFLI
ncbi:MAG: hypothetical protein F6K65_10410, partial [Moorea sp. SIO3C2]|nr:hypothetical protein [Moorena sp. SIO3C2]